MALQRQIIDSETGEVKSWGALGDNNNFVMLFRNEMSSLVNLQKTDAKAGALLMFLMQHMDRENALIVSIETMSEMLEWSTATIYRKLKVLRDNNFLTSQRTGNSSIYFINANVAWTTYGNKKQYAKFKANVLISKSEQEYRLKSSKFKQLDLLKS